MIDLAKPFIQLFKTPRSQYVFDVNQNEILPVSVESFDFLKQCMDGKADIGSTSIEELQMLMQNGYLRTESVVQEIQHPYTPYLKYLLERKLRKITLQVTQACNLRCKYCIYSDDVNPHQRSHSSRRMTWATAKKGIDFLWEHSVDSPEVNVGFYGGEPLLEFALIKRIVAYAKKTFDGKKISFSLTTNGTLITDEMINFLSEENIHLVVSLDGPKEIHDKSRVFADGRGSFDTVIGNVKKFRDRVPEYAKRIAFSVVVDPLNDYDCINEITIMAKDMNSHNFLAAIVDKDYDNNCDSLIFSEEYTWKSRYHEFLALLSLFIRYPEECVSALARSSLGLLVKKMNQKRASAPLRPVDVPSGPCIPGQLRLFVNADGRFFPCERVSELSTATCIGSLDNGFDVEQASKLLNIGKLTPQACKRCWSFRSCTLCAKRADISSEGLSAEYKLAHCANVQMTTYNVLRKTIFAHEVNSFYRDQVRLERISL